MARLAVQHFDAVDRHVTGIRVIVRGVDRVQIGAQHICGRAVRTGVPRSSQIARGHISSMRRQVVRHEHERGLASIAELEHAPQRPILEFSVANGEHLVHQQHVWARRATATAKASRAYMPLE